MQWEYYRLATVESCLDEALQDLGQEGWELVSVLPETRLFHGFQYLLKRPCTVTNKDQRNPPAIPHRFHKLVSVR
jgi:hypothetical protein